MSSDPIPGRFYRHYKGGLYIAHGVAIHTETGEELVIYRHVGGMLYARPLGNWREPSTGGRERFALLPADFKLPPLPANVQEHNPPGDELLGDESGPSY